ncbi:MAG TPA: YkvA family protein [Rhizomicrobium sp.]|nr:YkvA family protein [Rhizomicrobium sp.]
MDEKREALDIPVIPLPVVAVTQARYARIVRQGFWQKLARVAGRVPFAEDLAAAYFCVVDPATPSRVRGVILVALAWFVLPASFLPEFLAVLGLTDDAAVVALVAGIVRRHIKERHYQRARAVLGIAEPVSDEEIWGG